MALRRVFCPETMGCSGQGEGLLGLRYIGVVARAAIWCYTQQDPIGLAGGLNLYGFASGDPVNFADPFGLNPDRARIWAAAQQVARDRAIGFDDLDPRFQILAVVHPGAALVGRVGGAGRATQTLDAIASQFRNMARELGTHNHFRAARLELRGIDTGGQHVKELSDMARGLRGSARQLQGILGQEGLGAEARTEAQRLLSNVSRLADRIEAAMRAQ